MEATWLRHGDREEDRVAVVVQSEVVLEILLSGTKM